MPAEKLAQFLTLPELKINGVFKQGHASTLIVAEKDRANCEVCPRCAKPSTSLYDRRQVKVQDEPLRGVSVYLKIFKQRYFCKTCRKPFTESVPGIMPRRRTTQRYRRSLLWACENFSDLKSVRKAYRCSNSLLYGVIYEQLKVRLGQNLNYAWPRVVGIDEHFFRRSRGYREFATVFVDYPNKRLREVVLSKNSVELTESLKHIDGRENVNHVIIDLCDPYKKFVKDFFPRAELIADKFHVLRLITPHINRRRKEITGDKRSNPVRKLLLRNQRNLEYFQKKALNLWLDENAIIKELYLWKEWLHRFYRIKGYHHAARILTRITDQMAHSTLPEIKTLRRTLMKWREEILNYFKTRLTNARTEGFNNVAKLVQKRAYGYRSFRNYRLRLLNACF